MIESINARVTRPEHRPARGEGTPPVGPSEEEKALAAVDADVAAYGENLKKRGRGHPTSALRRLVRMLREYPREPFLEAVRTAARYGFYDLDRLDRMVLRGIAGDLFFTTESSPSEGSADTTAEDKPPVESRPDKKDETDD